MILCGCMMEVDRRVARGVCGHPPPPQTENRWREEKGGEGHRRAEKGGEGRRRVERVKKNVVATKQLMTVPRYGGVTV